MERLTKEEVKNIQLDILKYLDKVCYEEGITYTLAYGTLLGARRHKGFIPWDDDIDCFISMDDFDRLIELINSKDDYYKISCNTDKDYNLDFAKIYDTRTIINEDNVVVPSKGLFVDLFPIYGLGKTYEEAEHKLTKLRRQKRKFFYYNVCYSDKKGLRALVKNAYLFSLRMKYKVCSIKKALNKFNKATRESRVEDMNYIGYLDSPFSKNFLSKDMISKNDFFPLKEIEFEGFMAKCPNNVDKILEQLYGSSYMELPPVEERENHAIVAYRK